MSSRVSVTVSPDGTGDYRTVQEAIDAVPLSNTCRTVIRVAPGIYKQPIYIPKTKNYITLAGFSPEATVLTWNNTATKIDHHQAARIIGTGTFGCGSTIVEGEDFIAENITFENFAPEGSGQAVAIRVTADRCAFYNCRFLGWQDTLYLHYGKQYLKDCYIEGSVDFILGSSTVLLEHCHIHCKSAGFIVAQRRKTSQETTGYVFLRPKMWQKQDLNETSVAMESLVAELRNEKLVSTSARDAVKRASKETASIKRAVQSLGFDVYFTADGDCNVGIERNPTEIPQRSVCAVLTKDINDSVSHSEKAEFSEPVSVMEDSVSDNPLIRLCGSLCPMHTRDGECQWPNDACELCSDSEPNYWSESQL